jgi:integrase/recombinase XerD
MTDHFPAYRLWLDTAGASSRTITERIRGVHRMARHADTDPTALTSLQIMAWLASVSPGWSRATYRQHAASWHHFLVEFGIRDDDPMRQVPRARVPRSLPHPVTERHLADALAIARGDTRTMILLAAYAGLRVHEIAKVRGEHFEAGQLRVVGKGGSVALLPLHPLLRAEVVRYPRSGPWFRLLNGDPMTENGVYRRVTRVLREVGSQGTPHALRHRFGTQVLRTAGGNLRVAQELLRHASPVTTAIYTMVTDDERTEAVRMLA